jgi:hypothetical protein
MGYLRAFNYSKGVVKCDFASISDRLNVGKAVLRSLEDACVIMSSKCGTCSVLFCCDCVLHTPVVCVCTRLLLWECEIDDITFVKRCIVTGFWHYVAEMAK